MQLPIVLLSLLSIASAAPASLSPRAEAICGSVYYSASAVNAASQAACSHFRAGTTVGSNSYPHRYNNFEGFNFGGVASPYQEFPIMSSGSIYTGGEFTLASLKLFRCTLFRS